MEMTWNALRRSNCKSLTVALEKAVSLFAKATEYKIDVPHLFGAYTFARQCAKGLPMSKETLMETVKYAGEVASFIEGRLKGNEAVNELNRAVECLRFGLANEE